MQTGLGVDFGGVIAQVLGGDAEQAAAWVLNDVAPLPDAFEVLAEMNVLFLGRVWIVSKAGPETERMSREWLRDQQFHEKTGIPPRHLHFVQDRMGKLERCKQLGITHFLDDRTRNLDVLKEEVDHLFLFGGTSAAESIVAVENWGELRPLLLRSIYEYRYKPRR